MTDGGLLRVWQHSVGKRVYVWIRRFEGAGSCVCLAQADREVFKAAKIADEHPHLFRDTFAADLL